MNIHINPLSDRIHLPHSPSVASTNKFQQEENISVSSQRPITRLEHARLTTQDISALHFRRKMTSNVDELKGEKIIPWSNIVDAKLIFMSKKAMQVALKRILYRIEWEKLNEYIQECRRKLKENFQQFYIKIKATQKESKENST